MCSGGGMNKLVDIFTFLLVHWKQANRIPSTIRRRLRNLARKSNGLIKYENETSLKFVTRHLRIAVLSVKKKPHATAFDDSETSK